MFDPETLAAIRFAEEFGERCAPRPVLKPYEPKLAGRFDIPRPAADILYINMPAPKAKA